MHQSDDKAETIPIPPIPAVSKHNSRTWSCPHCDQVYTVTSKKRIMQHKEKCNKENEKEDESENDSVEANVTVDK